MYSLVQVSNSRLYMRGSRESADVDGVPDAIDAIGHRSPSPVGSTSRSSLHRYNASSSSRREHSDEIVSHSKFESRAQMASASQESKELIRNNNIRSGLKTVHTQKVIRKTTTISLGERKDSTHVKVRRHPSLSLSPLFLYPFICLIVHQCLLIASFMRSAWWNSSIFSKCSTRMKRRLRSLPMLASVLSPLDILLLTIDSLLSCYCVRFSFSLPISIAVSNTCWWCESFGEREKLFYSREDKAKAK